MTKSTKSSVMAITSIKDLEIQLKAAWRKIDEIETHLSEAAKQEAIRAAVEAALSQRKDKEIERKDKWLKLIWIPIGILIVSNIIAWLFKFLPTGGK